MRKNGRQDKESATTLFLTLSSCPRQGGKDKRETRFPLREVMTKKSTTDTRTRRYIRITDEGLWQQIDNISQIEKYSKSFNLIINDALFYGLPILYKKLFGDVQDETPETYERHREQVRDDGANDEFYQIIVRLLKEIVLNETINKSMLSSIFNACKEGYNGETVSGKEFAVGGYSGTPDYLESYELKGLKNIGGKKK